GGMAKLRRSYNGATAEKGLEHNGNGSGLSSE
ncbi:hypothetical protein A2U01_0069939, partial [Trifolium medium]|nr:hypothetical protein [Trifolium medium]